MSEAGTTLAARSVKRIGKCQASCMRASQPFTCRNTHTYHWRTNGSRWELVTAGRVVGKVVSDGVYVGIWRIDLGDGALSDMVNLTRAAFTSWWIGSADQATSVGREQAT
jgi:hypothetical protein